MAKIPVTGGAGFIGSHVVDQFLARGYEVVAVDGDGEQRRDFVYVGDCAYANYLALTKDHEPGFYNLGWSGPTSINDIFLGLADVTGSSHPIQHGPVKLGENRHICLDVQKAARELGWMPTVTLEQGLEKTVSYLRDSEQIR